MAEIPAYQAVDYVLGKVSDKLTHPMRGWVVTAPDRGIETALFTDEAEAQRHVERVEPEHQQMLMQVAHELQQGESKVDLGLHVRKSAVEGRAR